MKTRIDEIAPDLYRLSTYIAKIDLRFNQFLVTDDEPLLYHTGLRRMFPLVCDAGAKIVDPAHIRWISFSHFETDECGSQDEWRPLFPTCPQTAAGEYAAQTAGAAPPAPCPASKMVLNLQEVCVHSGRDTIFASDSCPGSG
jgi:hypothetical protein